MGKFFKSWRRRLGIVTLLMALVFMAGWIRSYGIYEGIGINASRDWACYLYSGGRKIGGGWVRTITESAPPDKLIDFHTEKCDSESMEKMFESMGTQWILDWGGFRFGETNINGPASMVTTDWQVPYWSIVIPLTFISAFLLLSKPRPSIQKKIVEPTPTEGT